MNGKTKKELVIAGRPVGPDYPPLVIAEMGINHEGSLKTAFEMVDAAARAGVEILKHQTHIVEDEMCKAAKNVIPGNADVSIYEIMKRCALPEEEEVALKEYVESKGMIFLSTPFSRAAADRLMRMDVKAFKIGSGECNNYPLLRHIAQAHKPVILSTGMNTISSIRKAVDIFRQYHVPVAILHTTNLYPTPSDFVRLGAMQEMAEAFPGCVYGLSDHTTSNLACLSAIALGASVVERHFTDRMDRKGPDICCSMDGSVTEKEMDSARMMALDEYDAAGLEAIYMSYYVPWDAHHNYEVAKRFGFRHMDHEHMREGALENYNHIDSSAYGLSGYIKYLKFGHAAATEMASRWIRAGHVTREEMIPLVKKHDKKLDQRMVDGYLQYTGMTPREFWRIMDKWYNRDLFYQDRDGVWHEKFEVGVGMVEGKRSILF